MKTLLVVIGLLMVLCGQAAAQALVDLPSYVREGTELVIAATDTMHFYGVLPANNATDRQGRETIYVPSGGKLVARTVYPTAVLLYAAKPFTYAASFVNGDLTGTVPVDTVGGLVIYGTAQDSVLTMVRFPCQTVVAGDLNKIVITPGTESPVHGKPLMNFIP